MFCSIFLHSHYTIRTKAAFAPCLLRIYTLGLGTDQIRSGYGVDTGLARQAYKLVYLSAKSKKALNYFAISLKAYTFASLFMQLLLHH